MHKLHFSERQNTDKFQPVSAELNMYTPNEKKNDIPAHEAVYAQRWFSSLTQRSGFLVAFKEINPILAQVSHHCSGTCVEYLTIHINYAACTHRSSYCLLAQILEEGVGGLL